MLPEADLVVAHGPSCRSRSGCGYRWKAGNSKGAILDFPSGPGQTGDLSFGTLRRALPGYQVPLARTRVGHGGGMDDPETLRKVRAYMAQLRT